MLAAAVGCAFGLTALPYYTLGMVAKPIGAEFDWPRAVVQGGILFASLGVLCSAGIAGWLIDRYGARRVALASQAGLALGFVGLSLQTGSTTLWYANWFLLAVFGVGTTPLTWSRGIASWFDRQRGLALGIGLTGTGVTAFLAPPLMTAIVASSGWRAGYLSIAAAIVLLAMPTVWLLFRERGEAAATPARRRRGRPERARRCHRGGRRRAYARRGAARLSLLDPDRVVPVHLRGSHRRERQPRADADRRRPRPPPRPPATPACWACS